jgi:hypothetical protein
MRISKTGFIAVMCCSLSTACPGQLRVGSGSTQSTPSTQVTPTPVAMPATPPPAPPFAASEILQPSLDAVRETLGSLKIDKWKKGSIRDEASSDVEAIQRDMQDNLPPLLKDADASKGTLTKVLPVARHVDALYDVLLRVVEAGRFAAPDDQANDLRQALSGLGNARLKLDDKVQERAVAEETQITDLRGVVQKQASFKCPAPPPTPVCTTPAPKKPKKKATSTTTNTTKTQSNSPANSTPPPAAVAPKTGP